MANQYDENLILGYVEGDLSAEDRAKVEALLASDPQLSALVVGMVQDCVALRSLPKEVPPGDLVDDVLGRVERGMLLGDPMEPMPVEAPAARSFRLSRLITYSGLAALLAISGGLLTYSLTTGGLLESAEEHADLGSYFENGGRRADATRPNRADRLAQAPQAAAESPQREAEAQTFAAAPTPEAAPTPAPSTLAAAGDESAPAETPKPKAMPEMAQSVQQMALEATAAPPSTFRFRRYQTQTPLVIRPTRRVERVVLEPNPAAAEDASELGIAAVAPLRVKVLTTDPGRTRRDVERWATSNFAEVLHDDAGASAAKAEPAGPEADRRAADAAAAVAGGDTGRRVLMVRVEPGRVSDLVQFLNRNGQEAGFVPLDTVVCRSKDRRRDRYAPSEANQLIGRQVAAAHAADKPEETARALTRQLEQLQRSVRQRKQSGVGAAAMAMQPARVPLNGDSEREDAADTASAAGAAEPALALVEPTRGGEGRGLVSNDWGLLFQYELPDPLLDGDASDGRDGEPLTVPVIISETKP